ncbi:GGDEF domain-containing protein [Actinoplanes sp. NPDC051470]|uniref:sensor domain-containing diguanylate cyclase n=1 Tax=unclassified Actinoplanes TaxID=2626549 RepID=UPI003444FB37
MTYLWLGWCALSVALTATRAFVPQDSLFATVVTASVSVLTCAAVLTVSRKPPFLLLAGSALADLAGNLVLTWNIQHGFVPYPSLSDLFWLLKYPLLAAGLMMLIRGLSWRHDRAGILDTLIVTVGLGLGVWLLFLQDLVHLGGMPPVTRLVTMAYPLADLMVLAAFIRFFTSSARRGAAFWQLTASLLALAAGHIMWVWQNSHGIHSDSTAPLFVLATLLLGGAALHPSMATFGTGTPIATGEATRARVLLIGSGCLISPVLLVVDGLASGGRVDWLAASICCVVVFALVIARMVELVRTVQDQATQLEAMAYIDGLTGIPNRRAWDIELNRRLAGARRQGRTLLVGLIDLDHFKRYNDEHGHQAGDQLLRGAAVAWRGQLRSEDLVARYGGEEFGLILGCRLTEVDGIMERLREVTPNGQAFSAGMAQWTGVETADQLVARADAALYTAKREGRNRTTVSSDPHLADVSFTTTR